MLSLFNKYFAAQSNLNGNFEEYMISKGFQNYIREFNSEIINRDSNRTIRDNTDNISEHSFMVSHRDFDMLNNDSIKISYLEERKSQTNLDNNRKESIITVNRGSTLHFKNSPIVGNIFEFNKDKRAESDNNIVSNNNLVINNLKDKSIVENKLDYEFDNFFKNNNINEIKI